MSTPASASPVRPLSLARITIDCSDYNARADEGSALGGLIDWVRTHPDRTSVHVVLRSSINSTSLRRCQSALQSLGCTVTARARFS